MDIISLTMYVIISFIAGTCLIGTAIDLFHISLGIPLIDKYYIFDFSAPINIRVVLFLFGVLIILCAIRQIQKIFNRSKHEQSITFNAPHGPISITLFAIEDMIKKMLDSKNELSHIRPCVTVKDDTLIIELKANIAADVNILTVTKDMQQKIHSKLNQLIGDQHNININVQIRKMFLGPKKHNEDEEAEVPFRNYAE